ncbi:MAG: Uma2 family endonuclease [Bryobacterales bacterium]|nr:Uma2 family endonuclease [Bryobacterales bacterium]MBV9399945.1 Uma2 family endonuclease [Bryobacterales bacterium]
MATRTALTEQEYLTTSFDNPDPEFRDGELVERSLPTFKHGRTQLRIGMRFETLSSKYPIYTSVETRTKIRKGQYLVSDVAVFLGAEPPDVPDFPPLVAVEVLSHDDRMQDVLEKVQEYRAWGVAHIWLVDPESRRLYVYDQELREVSCLCIAELEFNINSVDIVPSE